MFGSTDIPRGYALQVDEEGELHRTEPVTSWGSSDEPEEPTPLR